MADQKRYCIDRFIFYVATFFYVFFFKFLVIFLYLREVKWTKSIPQAQREASPGRPEEGKVQPGRGRPPHPASRVQLLEEQPVLQCLVLWELRADEDVEKGPGCQVCVCYFSFVCTSSSGFIRCFHISLIIYLFYNIFIFIW